MAAIEPCKNCKEKPVYIEMNDVNADEYEWSDKEDGEIFPHLILHKGYCPFGMQIYHETKAMAIKKWNAEQI